MSLELRELIDRENLELDCRALRKMKCSYVLGEDIDDLVCDTIDRLIDADLINHRETVDVAYYIANEIKRNFIIS